MTISRNSVFDSSKLLWTTTPAAIEVLSSVTKGTHPAAVSATGGILVYEDIDGTNKQIVDAEFTKSDYIFGVPITRILASGDVDGSTITTTATNVRIYW